MPKKYSTPDVYDKEIDLSEITLPVGTNRAGIVICAPRGRANHVTLVTSDKDFIENFGTPVLSGDNPIYGYGSYAALEFLQESDALYVVRATDPSEDFYAKSGISSSCSSYSLPAIGASAGPVSDKLDEIYAIDNAVISAAPLLISSVCPGDWGNDIAVVIETLTSASSWFYNYDDMPIGVDPQNIQTSAMPIANQVFKINVYKKESTESWESYTISKNGTSALSISPVETFLGTLTSMNDSNNQQLFIKDIVNGKSNLIYLDVNVNATTLSQSSFPYSVTSAGEVIGVKNESLIRLSGGSQTARSGIGTYFTAWEYFKDDAQYELDLLLLPDYTQTVQQAVNQYVVSQRKDCFLVTQVGTVNDVTVSQVIAAEKYGHMEPSYSGAYAGWCKYYDKYNAKNIYLPLSIMSGRIIARNDNVGSVFTAPSGMSRGVIPISNMNKVWSNAEIGQLYDKNINTARLINGTGFVIWGNKTLQTKASALDRINVRRTMIYIRKSIKKSMLQYVLDVNNNAKTRLRIWSNLDSFMSQVLAEGGLTAYKIICDESNNPPQIIDANILNVSIYVQPAKTVEFIEISYILTRTGVTIA